MALFPGNLPRSWLSRFRATASTTSWATTSRRLMTTDNSRTEDKTMPVTRCCSRRRVHLPTFNPFLWPSKVLRQKKWKSRSENLLRSRPKRRERVEEKFERKPSKINRSREDSTQITDPLLELKSQSLHRLMEIRFECLEWLANNLIFKLTEL